MFLSLFFQIAEDGNLYTRKEFEHYYGHKAYDKWAIALPCYEHAIAVIVDAGEVAHLTALDFLHGRTKTLFHPSSADNIIFEPTVQDERAQTCSERFKAKPEMEVPS